MLIDQEEFDKIDAWSQGYHSFLQKNDIEHQLPKRNPYKTWTDEYKQFELGVKDAEEFVNENENEKQ